MGMTVKRWWWRGVFVLPEASDCRGLPAPYMVVWHHPRGWSEEDVETEYLVTSLPPYIETRKRIAFGNRFLIHLHTTQGINKFKQDLSDYTQMWQAHNHIAQTEITVPLDPLESTAGHVNNASCWSGYCTNQTFSNTFKKARCPLFLGTCIITQTLQIEFKDLQHQMPESSVQWKHTNRTGSFLMSF